MKPVTTYDGRTVDSSSEEWRAHCEATTLLSWPLHNRRVHMEGVLSKRGKEAHKELSELVSTIWKERQVKLLLKMDTDRERIVHLTRLERATNMHMRASVESILKGRLSAEVV